MSPFHRSERDLDCKDRARWEEGIMGHGAEQGEMREGTK